MRYPVIIYFILLCGVVYSQTTDQDIDYKYLEDQFYLGITYNLVLNKPQNVTQRNFSYGLMGGFIKDLPLNSRRNVGLGIGFGYAYNTYYTNLFAQQSAEGTTYTVLPRDASYKRNKIDTHVLEFPIEFRWRTSTPTEYKFWRIYTGMKLGYVLGSRSKFVSDEGKIAFQNNDIDRFRYGVMLNVGYSTFNVHVYYALNTLFKNDITTVDGDPVGFTPLRLGIIFYIL